MKKKIMIKTYKIKIKIKIKIRDKKMLWIVREHVNEYKCDNTINLTIGLCKIKDKQLKLKG
jgi:hypothetical protein